MNEKEQFIEGLKSRTKSLSVEIIKLCDNLKKCKTSDVIIYQLIKSSTSTAANYRVACRARSRAEFYSKICIVVEESDETEFWLELIDETKLYNDQDHLSNLLNEANEITKIMTKAKDSSYKYKNK